MESGPEQPTGTVTLVFTDIEGSTVLLRDLGAEAYREVLGDHRRVVRAAFADHGGYEVDEEGDAFFFAFASARAAVAAVREATARLADGPVRVRVGVHTGEPLVDPPNYVGEDVHLAARIMSAGHGGQVLLSRTTRALVEGELRELGEHRLKDFPEAVALFQLGDGRFPPLRTISNTNLPRPVSSFVGREREVAEVVSLVRDRGARLVTLSGPGGTGKTRLAIEAAAELVGDFAAGVYWVELAAVRDPTLVVGEIARTLGANRGVAEQIGERELLLVLDNLEQVVEAAPDLTPLLRACPRLRMLVTSRELLRVEGEIAYAVPALDGEEAVELFCARARIRASETVAELCRRLDNLPLAVELAAARIGVLLPEQILDRISQRLDLFRGRRDADARQQTLRATISWSFDLLSPVERSLYARLSVFAGGFALEAAGEVCDATLDAIESLVDKSLLRHTGERFWMLETIREFAAERLDESVEDEETRRRHAWYFLGLFERHDEARRERRETFKEYAALVSGEEENARRALAWFRARGDAGESARIVGALHPLWAGNPSEGRAILDAVLAETEIPDDVRGRVLYSAAIVAANQEDRAAQKRYLEEARSLYERLGHRRRLAEVLLDLTSSAIWERDFDGVRTLLREGREIATEIDDRLLLARASQAEAHIPLYQGDFASAERLFEEALRLAREADADRLVKVGLYNIGLAVLEQGQVDRAASLFRESLSVGNDLSPFVAWAAVEGLAAVAVARGGAATAARLLGAAEEWRRTTGFGTDPFDSARADRTAAAALGALGEDAYSGLAAEGARLELDEAVELALTIQGKS